MATKFEYWDTLQDTQSYVQIFGADWNAQTFTPSIAHTIGKVVLRGYRTGSPGTVTVSIRAVDGNGLPTGSDLSSGTFDGNTLGLGLANIAWFTISISGYTLSAGTKYAIVFRATSGDASNRLNLHSTYTIGNPGYTGGTDCYSGDSGATWVENSDDFLFEEWSFDLVVGRHLWVEGTGLHYFTLAEAEKTITGTDTLANGTLDGQIWVEGTYLHYIDANLDERRTEGVLDGATGKLSGHIWVEGNNLRYIDSNGDERYIAGV